LREGYEKLMSWNIFHKIYFMTTDLADRCCEKIDNFLMRNSDNTLVVNLDNPMANSHASTFRDATA
jgi:hypothetical protein